MITPNEVPNVPCGVESEEETLKLQSACRFLMYRVELKDVVQPRSLAKLNICVPNVPCGVESFVLSPACQPSDFNCS
jgi:hypothetical protein